MLQISKDEFLSLRENDDNWLQVMNKIAYRDARKDALDLKKIEKPIEKEIVDDSMLTSMLPT